MRRIRVNFAVLLLAVRWLLVWGACMGPQQGGVCLFCLGVKTCRLALLVRYCCCWCWCNLDAFSLVREQVDYAIPEQATVSPACAELLRSIFIKDIAGRITLQARPYDCSSQWKIKWRVIQHTMRQRDGWQLTRMHTIRAEPCQGACSR